MKLFSARCLFPLIGLFLFLSCSYASPIDAVQLNPETSLSTRQINDRGMCSPQGDSRICQLSSLTNKYNGVMSLFAFRSDCGLLGYTPRIPSEHFDFHVNLPWIIVVSLYNGKYMQMRYGGGSYQLGYNACFYNDWGDIICRINFRCD